MIKNKKLKVIIVNGAPFTGKDTFVDYTLELYKNANDLKIKKFMFKDVLYKESYKRLSEINEFNEYVKDFDMWLYYCSNSSNLKEVPMQFTGRNLSPRQELIYQSENIIKLTHGITGVAKITSEYINNYVMQEEAENIFCIFPDGGFNYEVNALKEYLNIKEDDIFVVRLLRDGCTFDNDSREYIHNPNITIENNSDKKSFYEKIKNNENFVAFMNV